jgi:hypothetical protein
MKKIGKKSSQVKHSDAVFIAVASDVRHLKIAKGTKIYEIDLF